MPGKRRPGIPARLDQVQGKANATMDVAQGVMLRLEARLDQAIKDLLDGVTVELDIAGKTLPCKLRLVAKEAKEAKE